MSSGRQIKFHRQAKHMTQQQLATGICSIPYLSKIENDIVTPSKEIYRLLAKRLDIQSSSLSDHAHKDRDRLLNKMNQWHASMVMQHVQKSEELYQEISTDVAAVTDHDLLIPYKIFSLRYYLLIRQLDEADLLLIDLNKHQVFFTEVQNLHYYKFLGIYYNSKGQLTDALNSLRHAEDINSQLHIADPELEFYLAMVYSRVDKIPDSITHAHNALDLFQKHFNYTRASDCCLILGISFNLVGSYDKAEYYIKKVLSFNQSTDHQQWAYIYHNLAFIHYNTTDHHKALKEIDQAIAYENNDKENIPAFHLKAMILIEKGDFQAADMLVEKGLALAARYNNQKFEYKFFMLMLRLHPNRDEKITLAKVEHDIIPYFKEHGDFHEYRKALNLVGDYYYKYRAYKSAAEFYKEASLTLINNHDTFKEV